MITETTCSKTIWFTKIVQANLGENILLVFEAQIHKHFFNKMAVQYLVSTGHTILYNKSLPSYSSSLLFMSHPSLSCGTLCYADIV